MELENNLKKEIDKWTAKINAEIKNIKLAEKTEKNENFLTNINAYISDSRHFRQKGDLIRSFEAIIWAWSWLEILRELKIIE